MKFNKLIKGIAVAGAFLVFNASALGKSTEEVNIYHWAEYVAEDTIPGFERSTGIKVNFDTFDNNDVLQTKLLIGKSGYDVVIPSSYYAKRQIEAGRLETNLKYLDPDIMIILKNVAPTNQNIQPRAMET